MNDDLEISSPDGFTLELSKTWQSAFVFLHESNMPVARAKVIHALVCTRNTVYRAFSSKCLIPDAQRIRKCELFSCLSSSTGYSPPCLMPRK
jgi:hypothetical protein